MPHQGPRCPVETPTLVVLDDADLNTAVNAAVFSRFAHQGQVCMCSNRMLVQRGVHGKFLDKFVDRVSKLRVGDPREGGTDLGPLINERQAETFRKQIERGIDEGAKLALEGKKERWQLRAA
jgi:acyl-CoA reductase-like NAD-dependent aldehyde dehydrogenase